MRTLAPFLLLDVGNSGSSAILNRFRTAATSEQIIRTYRFPELLPERMAITLKPVSSPRPIKGSIHSLAELDAGRWRLAGQPSQRRSGLGDDFDPGVREPLAVANAR